MSAPPASLSQRLRHRLKLPLLIIVVLVALSAIGNWLYGEYNHVVVYDSRIKADVYTISSRSAGLVSSIPVSEGDRVTAGQVLATIDGREIEAQLREVDAQIAGLESQRGRIGAEIGMIDLQSQGRLEASRAALEAAQAAENALRSDLDLAESEFRRAESLLANKVISRQRWESARNSMLKAQQAYAQGTAEVARARAAVGEAQAGRRQIEILEQQRATLAHSTQELEARRSRLQIDLDDRSVKAPADGIIDRIFLDPGEFAAPGQRMLLLHDPVNIWVEANVKETDLRFLRVGGPANVTIDAYPGVSLTGEVVRIGQAATSQFALLPSPNPSGNFTKITQRLPVKIAIPQIEGELLRPGMMVEVEIAVHRD